MLGEAKKGFGISFGLIFLMVISTWFGFSEDKPQVVPSETPRVKAMRKALDAEIEALSKRMIEINDWMYHNPEPGFLEFKAAEMLTEELRRHGFTVEMGIPGLGEEIDLMKVVGGFPADYSGPPGIPTAFKAKYKGASLRQKAKAEHAAWLEKYNE